MSANDGKNETRWLKQIDSRVHPSFPPDCTCSMEAPLWMRDALNMNLNFFFFLFLHKKNRPFEPDDHERFKKKKKSSFLYIFLKLFRSCPITGLWKPTQKCRNFQSSDRLEAAPEVETRVLTGN